MPFQRFFALSTNSGSISTPQAQSKFEESHLSNALKNAPVPIDGSRKRIGLKSSRTLSAYFTISSARVPGVANCPTMFLSAFVFSVSKRSCSRSLSDSTISICDPFVISPFAAGRQSYVLKSSPNPRPLHNQDSRHQNTHTEIILAKGPCRRFC